MIQQSDLRRGKLISLLPSEMSGICLSAIALLNMFLELLSLLMSNFLPFMGGAAFECTCIPNRLAKDGLKLVMVCDVDSKYMFNAIPYLGKQRYSPGGAKGLSQGHCFTQELTEPYFHTRRNTTSNSWLTSFQISLDMFKNRGLTTVGALRGNEPHTCPEMI